MSVLIEYSVPGFVGGDRGRSVCQSNCLDKLIAKCLRNDLFTELAYFFTIYLNCLQAGIGKRVSRFRYFTWQSRVMGHKIAKKENRENTENVNTIRKINIQSGKRLCQSPLNKGVQVRKECLSKH